MGPNADEGIQGKEYGGCSAGYEIACGYVSAKGRKEVCRGHAEISSLDAEGRLEQKN